MYDLTSMSCSYVLAGHTDVVLCLDTCVSSSGRTLIVTGSKDNTVSLSHLLLLLEQYAAFDCMLLLLIFTCQVSKISIKLFCYSNSSASIG